MQSMSTRIIHGLDSANPARITASCARTAEVLRELLTLTIHLRDCYQWAQRKAAGLPYRSMRALLAEHYTGQVRLVDVLLDRLHQMPVNSAALAGMCRRDNKFSHPQDFRGDLGRWLRELLDAHEDILMTARPPVGAQACGWVEDFAVGHVVLTNDLQREATWRCLRASGMGPWILGMAVQGEEYE